MVWLSPNELEEKEGKLVDLTCLDMRTVEPPPPPSVETSASITDFHPSLGGAKLKLRVNRWGWKFPRKSEKRARMSESYVRCITTYMRIYCKVGSILSGGCCLATRGGAKRALFYVLRRRNSSSKDKTWPKEKISRQSSHGVGLLCVCLKKSMVRKHFSSPLRWPFGSSSSSSSSPSHLEGSENNNVECSRSQMRFLDEEVILMSQRRSALSEAVSRLMMPPPPPPINPVVTREHCQKPTRASSSSSQPENKRRMRVDLLGKSRLNLYCVSILLKERENWVFTITPIPLLYMCRQRGTYHPGVGWGVRTDCCVWLGMRERISKAFLSFFPLCCQPPTRNDDGNRGDEDIIDNRWRWRRQPSNNL